MVQCIIVTILHKCNKIMFNNVCIKIIKIGRKVYNIITNNIYDVYHIVITVIFVYVSMMSNSIYSFNRFFFDCVITFIFIFLCYTIIFVIFKYVVFLIGFVCQPENNTKVILLYPK